VYILQVDCPVTIFHGTNDGVIPYASGKKLYDSIPEGQKELITVESAGHHNLIEFDTYLSGLDRTLGIDDQSNRAEDK
jgi:fermentation-respiration switch protein FrsA (DUF1100 family)